MRLTLGKSLSHYEPQFLPLLKKNLHSYFESKTNIYEHASVLFCISTIQFFNNNILKMHF